MAYTRVKTDFFLAERRRVQEFTSRLLLSAVDCIEGSLWLIAGGRLAQALVMLDNAVELALKADLDRVHRIVIADTKKLDDFATLRSLLGDAFLKHPSAGTVPTPDFDIEKTICFEEAFDRVADLYPGLSDAWRRRVTSPRGSRQISLHSLRNSIVHYGGNPEAEGQYVQAIIDTAFPFLEDLITRMTGGTVWLPALLKEWIFREIKVAQLVLRDLQSEHGSPKPYVIKTLQHHILWTYGAWPSPRDDLATLSVSAETDWEAYVERQKRNLRKTWDESLMVELPCPICDSETGDGSDVAAQVLLEDHPLEENRLVPEGFNCFVCGLHISPSERFLARHFVGAIPEDIAGAYLKDIGRA